MKISERIREGGGESDSPHQADVGVWPALRYQPLYKLTRSAILEKIEKGYFQKGDILPSTRQMAKMFGVSIITIRNAVKCLQDEKIVKARHGQGVVVMKSDNNEYRTGLDNLITALGKGKKIRSVEKCAIEKIKQGLNLLEEVEELFDIRAILEAEAAKLACGNVVAEAIRILENRANDLLKQKTPSAGAGFQLDLDIHQMILQNCRNKRLVYMINKLNEEIEIYRLLHSKEMSREDTRSVLKDHLRIIHAFLAGEPDECANLVRKHIEQARNDCLTKWKGNKRP